MTTVWMSLLHLMSVEMKTAQTKIKETMKNIRTSAQRKNTNLTNKVSMTNMQKEIFMREKATMRMEGSQKSAWKITTIASKKRISMPPIRIPSNQESSPSVFEGWSHEFKINSECKQSHESVKMIS